jgi:hypothetical protein
VRFALQALHEIRAAIARGAPRAALDAGVAAAIVMVERIARDESETPLCAARAAGLRAGGELARRDATWWAARAQEFAGHPRAVEYQARSEAANDLALACDARAAEVERRWRG